MTPILSEVLNPLLFSWILQSCLLFSDKFKISNRNEKKKNDLEKSTVSQEWS